MGTAKATGSTQKVKQDEFIMGTNNSSIVSKRSVERLYYEEPHFFRHFVKKPQRRSPLINRGYWLRMHAVEQVVRQFLLKPSEKCKKIVLNLGSGFDPLAFQWLSRAPEICNGVTFVDVDYPALIAKKVDVIASEPHLNNLLQDAEKNSTSSGILLRSQNYIAIGCDLTNIAELDKLWRTEIDVSECMVLCTAEVSVTYMDTISANELIRWAAGREDMHFCLLEQYTPAGPSHPFARKMFEHFRKMQTPLRSVHTYPTLRSQEQRFIEAGWALVVAQSLWNVWDNPSFVSSDEKAALNSVEPFDEWEEFVLFASHYFLLVASSRKDPESNKIFPLFGDVIHSPNGSCEAETLGDNKMLLRVQDARAEPRVKRRFGALFQISEKIIGHHGGFGAQSRSNSTDLYSIEEASSPNNDKVMDAVSPNLIKFQAPNVSHGRMCHTITLTDHGCLLVGGRTSPDHPLRDCWLLDRGIWEKSDNLPAPLYRHCAVRIDLTGGGDAYSGVLIFGGKTSACQTVSSWLLWRHQCGWIELPASEKFLEPRFGAAMFSTGPGTGALLGGMTSEGTILSDIWDWSVIQGTKGYIVQLERRTAIYPRAAGDVKATSASTSTVDVPGSTKAEWAITRVGACLVHSSRGPMLIGGVSNSLERHSDIVSLSRAGCGKHKDREWVLACLHHSKSDDPPLLVGHTALLLDDSVLVAGGGAVCFSFGTHWNVYPSILSTEITPNHFTLRALPDTEDSQFASTDVRIGPQRISPNLEGNTTIVQHANIKSSVEFNNVIRSGQPAVLKDLDIGICSRCWTLDYLKSKVGSDREVVVHEASDIHMDFQKKNFVYVKKSFGSFIDEISNGSKQYLRSLAVEGPSSKPANFALDFPQLVNDFNLPSELIEVRNNMHSSVLRISGPVKMWLHYDVMANVLCQIHGSKRLIVYPPGDVTHLSLAPGASSSSIDPFAEDLSAYPSLVQTHPYSVLLEPGDVLYLPPLWLHAATPTLSTSISVNCFFRSMESEIENRKDVYANRDLQVYEQGRKDIQKIAKKFDRLPTDMATFYLERLAQELQHSAGRNET